MQLLLDTRCLLWGLSDDGRLGSSARAAIADPTTEVLVSAASAWEIAVKRATGTLEAAFDVAEELRAEHFAELARAPVCVADTGDIRRERTVAAVVLLPEEGAMHIRPGDPSASSTQAFGLRQASATPVG